LDGKSACYLTITDEKTGSWLCALTFAYGRISQVPVEEVRQRLIKYFIRWGKPGAMRVDNGDPLGHSTKLMTPPLALWLIAMDIDMIWNKPSDGRRIAHNKTEWLKICKELHLGGLN
jgi:hypothetical protein